MENFMRSRILLLAALLVLGSGCGVKLAYNNLDRLARWSISDYVRFDAEQRAYFDAAVAEIWGWHRREHLPRYADQVDRFALRVMDRDAPAALLDMIVTVSGWYDEIEARTLPAAAHLLASLSDAQVEALASNLAARNAELAEPELGVEEAAAQATWAREIADRMSRFTGRLNPVQTAYLAEQSRRYRPERVLWADYWARWQGDLLALLKHRTDPVAFEQGFRQLVANRESYYGLELARVFEHNRALSLETNVWLLGSLTDRQRGRFVDRLESLAGDLRDLANDQRRGRVSDLELPCLVGC
jgi:hypothetical protein